MNNLQINTTQNVNLNYTIVSIGERIVAFFIDAFILYLYFILVNLIGDAIGYIYSDGWTQRGLVALISLPAMFYTLLMHITFNGRTVGKMIMKMRVVKVCLLYTSDAADDMQCVDLGGRRIIKKSGVC